MINRYYQKELAYLRELGVEFARAHPAIAPMLSGQTTDPDVERLLEGVAFLNGMLRQKLDDEFPEIAHSLMELICPHYLRPVPATTLIAFQPKPTLKQSQSIPAGIQIGSVPVEGTSCLFRTSYDVEIHPLSITGAGFSHPSGQAPRITVSLELNGLNLSQWNLNRLRFFIGGDYASGTDVYLLLCNHLKQITLRPLHEGASCTLDAGCLKQVGFGKENSLIPYPSHAFPGYRNIQEYFTVPQKFLFIDIEGWEQWRGRGKGARFEIVFELQETPFGSPRIGNDSFVLFVSPAINIFPHEAEPVMLDHRQEQYQVRPSGSNREHYQVYSVENVTGYIHGTAKERAYVPFDCFRSGLESDPVYHISKRRSSVHDGFDVYLSVAYPKDAGAFPVSETLSIDLSCTNASLPGRLQTGDINQPTSSSPEFVDFRNIMRPTPNVPPPLGSNLLWHLISHLSLNYLSLTEAENLRALLGLYIFPEGRDQAVTLAHRKRISGIDSVGSRASHRLVSGFVMRGQDIELQLRLDHFASPGDLFLFGCVLDHFFGGYTSLNSYSRLIIRENTRGYRYQWKPRIGHRHLL